MTRSRHFDFQREQDEIRRQQEERMRERSHEFLGNLWDAAKDEWGAHMDNVVHFANWVRDSGVLQSFRDRPSPSDALADRFERTRGIEQPLISQPLGVAGEVADFLIGRPLDYIIDRALGGAEQQRDIRGRPMGTEAEAADEPSREIEPDPTRGDQLRQHLHERLRVGQGREFLDPDELQRQTEPPIGLDEPGERMQRHDIPRDIRHRPMADSPETIEGPQPYMAGDEQRPRREGWPTNRIADLQRRMTAAGVLVEDFHLGVWDQASEEAYFTILGQANRWAVNENEAMARMEEIRRESDERWFQDQLDAFQAQLPDYIRPNQAELEQTVTSAIRQRLGRDPTPAEIADFADKMAVGFRSEYDQNIEQARRQWEREMEVAARERNPAMDAAGMDPTADLPIDPSDPQEVEEVNPVAEFNRNLERYAQPRDDMEDRREATGTGRASLEGGFNMLRRAVGR